MSFACFYLTKIFSQPYNTSVFRKHYKEYLVQLIRHYRLDPVVIYSIDELKRTLSRHKISYSSEDGYSKQEYEKILRDVSYSGYESFRPSYLRFHDPIYIIFFSG